MGFFGDLLGGAADLITDVIPGPVDDLIVGGIRKIFDDDEPPRRPRREPPRRPRRVEPPRRPRRVQPGIDLDDFRPPTIRSAPRGFEGRRDLLGRDILVPTGPLAGLGRGSVATAGISGPLARLALRLGSGLFGTPTAAAATGAAVGTAAAAAPMIFGPNGAKPDLALEPEVREVERRVCPAGWVLGIDGLCYHKTMISNKFRAHPKDPKPPVTAGDVKAIRRADRTRKRLVTLTKKSGAHASMTRPRSSSRKPPVRHVQHVHVDD